MSRDTYELKMQVLVTNETSKINRFSGYATGVPRHQTAFCLLA